MTFVIVGGGECAAHAAFALRDRGFTGAITVLGRERLHAYERPPLSKVMLAGHDLDPVHPYTAEQFGEAAIELRTSTEVVRIDTDRHRAVLADGEQIGFDRALLAVGAQPRRIRLAPDPAVLYLRTHQDALRIREALAPGRRIGIVGAGFIGLELAAGARGRGCEVTVIEATDRALVRVVPASVASDVVSLHERNGVRFHWHATLTRLRREGTRLVAGVTGAPDLTFDTVIVGIGAAPDVRVAEASGLKVENGVVVDDRLCADGDVFAAGDCASFPHPRFSGARIRLESWRNAREQAETAAANMLGADQPHAAVPWFWSDQYDHTLQVTGLSALATTSTVRVRDDGVQVYFGLDDHRRLLCASAFGPGNAVARDVRLTEKLIESGEPVPLDALADASVPLKTLLAATSRR